MNKLFERVKAAVTADPSIIVAKEETDKTNGFPQSYLESLGLSKGDLTKLERGGVALRGYLPTRKGNRVRWMLLKD